LRENGKLDWATFEKSLDFTFGKDLEDMKALWRAKSGVRWSLWDLDDCLAQVSEFDSEGLPVFKKVEQTCSLEDW
jgi:hypothetical protein